MFYVENKFVFYHIPKNAGSVLSDILKQKYHNDSCLKTPLNGFWLRDDYEHKPLHWFIDNMIIPIHLPIITTCRNPYRRAVSSYFHSVKNKRQKADRRKRGLNISLIAKHESQSFEDFLNKKIDISSHKIDKNLDITFGDVYKMRDWNWTDPQMRFLKNVNLDNVTIFKIEEPDKINKFFKIDIDSWDGDRNQSEDLEKDKNLWRTFYNKETIKLVKDMYAEDFDRLNYSTHIDDA